MNKKEEEKDNGFKIKEINEEEIIFTNGKKITYYHSQDCCEDVYAAFDEIDDIATEYTFHEPLIFTNVEDYGFRFGNNGLMVGVPCYDIQNGYYSDNLDIYYDGKKVFKNSCCTKHEYF